jgi:hypothetical protein
MHGRSNKRWMCRKSGSKTRWRRRRIGMNNAISLPRSAIFCLASGIACSESGPRFSESKNEFSKSGMASLLSAISWWSRKIRWQPIASSLQSQAGQELLTAQLGKPRLAGMKSVTSSSVSAISCWQASIAWQPSRRVVTPSEQATFRRRESVLSEQRRFGSQRKGAAAGGVSDGKRLSGLPKSVSDWPSKSC